MFESPTNATKHDDTPFEPLALTPPWDAHCNISLVTVRCSSSKTRYSASASLSAGFLTVPNFWTCPVDLMVHKYATVWLNLYHMHDRVTWIFFPFWNAICGSIFSLHHNVFSQTCAFSQELKMTDLSPHDGLSLFVILCENFSISTRYELCREKLKAHTVLIPVPFYSKAVSHVIRATLVKE